MRDFILNCCDSCSRNKQVNNESYFLWMQINVKICFARDDSQKRTSPPYVTDSRLSPRNVPKRCTQFQSDGEQTILLDHSFYEFSF